MASILPEVGAGIIRRERRREGPRIDAEMAEGLVNRVLKMADKDVEERAEDRERRLQRYAKYRQWTEGKSWPWENSSDVALPDITEACLGLQDTLTNAILSSRPVVSANAIKPENRANEEKIDKVLDFQFFVEQEGEKIVEELAEQFIVDGNFRAYIPWVRERRPVTDVRIFEEIPLEQVPVQHFQTILSQEYREASFKKRDEEGWDWTVMPSDGGDDFDVSFYTNDSREVEMVVTREVMVYDGPRVIVKDYDDVLAPGRCSNLQAPGPHNPGGAPHVILVDYPTVEEVRALVRDGTYDRVGDEDLEFLGNRARDDIREEAKRQKDATQGVQDELPEDPEHRTLTRYTCFDVYDLDGDGVAEDVIWWVLREAKLLLRAKPLTEIFPTDPPRRPLAEAQFLPVKGRCEGVSLPELMEGMHDFLKRLLDQGVDAGLLANMPFFFYRAASSMKPEVIRPWPGDGIPLSEPQRDVFFPQIPFDPSFHLNTFFLGRQLEERLTLQGDLQAGKVPTGKASALRTAQGIQTILAQGEARPERILRRFFMGFAEIFRQMHELNQHFFPERKKIRVMGVGEPGDDPYPEITRGGDLEGRFVFDFRASILNASKVAQQQGFQQLFLTLLNPLMIQLGIIGPEQIFRLTHDFAKALGQEPDRYILKPAPEIDQPRLTAEEALSMISDHLIPKGAPAEPAAEHLQRIGEFSNTALLGTFDPGQTEVLRGWIATVTQIAQREAQIAQQAQAAGQLRSALASAGAQGGGGEATAPDRSNPNTERGELLDESLPGNGRGT